MKIDDRLREDEIEALLKFEGAKMFVYGGSSDTPFVCVINIAQLQHNIDTKNHVRSVSHQDKTRLGAVRGAWGKYNALKEDTSKWRSLKKSKQLYWYVEEASANITQELYTHIYSKGKRK